eukprot:gb/GEZN01019714.1/.p1 GENE.gb/GEZN01019714.1/~~gb/GEZN01019714.1/.p1  ORF type:complete len:133 (-),score=13.90 gb/GEZN01019714.1/:249-647(-)
MGDAKSQADEIAKKFMRFYYTAFDDTAARVKLRALYRPGSKLFFDGKECVGPDAIIQHLCQGLKFKQIKHHIKTWDVVQSGAPRALLILVCGDVKVDDSPNALKFSQAFHIVGNEQMNNFFIAQDIFRLNYG